MKKGQKDRISVRFGHPEPNSNIVKVTKVLPDNTEEFIGQIYPDFTDGEDSSKYVSVNTLGEELLPPTSDFIEIEDRFINYAHEMDERSFTNEMEAKALEFEKRGKSLRSLRQFKFRLQSKFINR